MTESLRIEQVGGMDLAEAAKRLAKVDKGLSKELRRQMAAPVEAMKREAQSKMATRPGGGSYPRRTGAIRSGASPTKASVWVGYPSASIARYPWALGAEYGAKRAWVRVGYGWRYGRVTLQGKLRRRMFPVWRGNQWVIRGAGGPGWILQPVMRRRFPDMESDVIKAIDRVFAEAVTKL